MRILLFILLLLAPVWADDQAELARLTRAWGRMTVFRTAGEYALVDWEQGDGAGQALYRKIDGQWWLLTGGGGVVAEASTLWQYGVPEWVIKKLAPHAGSLNEAKAAGPYWSWLTQKKDLTDQDLESYPAFELTLMRNEIFAMRGRVFQDPILAAYFKSRSWYRPNPEFNEALLTARERRNAAFISAYQKRTKREF